MTDKPKKTLEQVFKDGVEAGWNKSAEGNNSEYSIWGYDTDEGFKKMQEELLVEYMEEIND